MMTMMFDLDRECPPGRHQTTTRWQLEDRRTVDQAAAALNMAVAEFMRVVALQAAEQVLARRNDPVARTVSSAATP